MIGNILLLKDVKPIRGGTVSFASDKGGRITAQGLLSNDRVSFEKVNYCKELANNLLSVSQICEKKYVVAFDDEKAFILKKDFKIPESMILMTAPREGDLYSLDMSVASPTSGTGQQAFVTKASEQESISWHKRMGHLSYRKMNVLVRKGLVEGISVKAFQTPEDCISCKMGKQKKKSHSLKKYNSITTPLELKHMNDQTFNRMHQFQGRSTKPADRSMICHLKSADYVCPEANKWRNGDSDSEEEGVDMNKYVEARKKAETSRKTVSATSSTKKGSKTEVAGLVDEETDDEVEITESIEGT